MLLLIRLLLHHIKILIHLLRVIVLDLVLKMIQEEHLRLVKLLDDPPHLRWAAL